jgi:nuclear GTP-binding protein
MKLKRRTESKRQTFHNKYKIEKKVKDHNKKLRKAVKKNALNKRPRLKKDPGIPNLFPFKQDLLEKIVQKREKEKEETEKIKQEKKLMKEKRKEMQDEDVI